MNKVQRAQIDFLAARNRFSETFPAYQDRDAPLPHMGTYCSESHYIKRLQRRAFFMDALREKHLKEQDIGG